MRLLTGHTLCTVSPLLVIIILRSLWTIGTAGFTRNYVELPTAIRNKPLDIKVWGEIDLEMSYKSGTHHGRYDPSLKRSLLGDS